MSDHRTDRSRWSGRMYLRFLAAVASTLALLAAAGWAVATWRQDDSLVPAAAALAAVGLASALAGIPLAVAGGTPQAALSRSLAAMLVRLALVAALAAVCVVVLDLARRPFLIWLVIGYLTLLAVDTAFTVRASRGG